MFRFTVEKKVAHLIECWNEFTTYDVEFKTYQHDVTTTLLNTPMIDLISQAEDIFDNVVYCPIGEELRFQTKGHYFRFDGVELEISQFTYSK